MTPSGPLTYKLTATITHKCSVHPIVHELFYQGNTFRDILAQIEAPEHHLKNLKHHGKAAFKDVFGAKHTWRLELVKSLN